MRACLIPSILLFCLAGSVSQSARLVTGTLTEPASDAGVLRVSKDGDVTTFRSAPKAKILRGQVGKDVRAVPLRDLAPGDHVIAVVDQGGRATSIKSFYAIVTGTPHKLQGDSLVFQDGQTVRLRRDTKIVLASGKTGNLADLKRHSLVVCRLNPVTGQTWAVVCAKPAAEEAPTKKQPSVASTPAADGVRIQSLTYSAPAPLRPGDSVSVRMRGTPDGCALFEVKGLIPRTSMVETSPGLYESTVRVPVGKEVRDAPLVGRLSVGKTQAAPVQAARLLTVAKPAPASISEGAGPVAEADRKPDKPPAKAPERIAQPARQHIRILSPGPRETVTRALTVRGTAQPGSSVRVTVHYTNGLGGVLALSGEAASRVVTVGKNGEFEAGPVPLADVLATEGLTFTVRASYLDKPEHGAAQVVFHGARR